MVMPRWMFGGIRCTLICGKNCDQISTPPQSLIFAANLQEAMPLRGRFGESCAVFAVNEKTLPDTSSEQFLIRCLHIHFSARALGSNVIRLTLSHGMWYSYSHTFMGLRGTLSVHENSERRDSQSCGGSAG